MGFLSGGGFWVACRGSGAPSLEKALLAPSRFRLSTGVLFGLKLKAPPFKAEKRLAPASKIELLARKATKTSSVPPARTASGSLL